MKLRRVRSDLQDYYNDSYIGSLLDETVFDALNGSGDVTFLYRHGAMDAPDFIPAGSMKCNPCGWDRSTIERGLTLAQTQERDSYLETLFSEE